MSGDAPRVVSYSVSGSPEFLLGYGPNDGPQLIVIQPLFEEMNRCRALVSTLCRGLARQGIGCWLPDLPGTGESPRALESVSWAQWQAAVRSVDELVRAQTGRSPNSIALRGGALLDGAIETRRWRLAPTSGRSLLSDLRRSALMGGGDPSSPAGYRLGPELTQALQAADSVDGFNIRTLRLGSDDRPADRHVEGSPIWRRPEPGTDPALANIIIEDVASWTMR
jgi:hypothetical protein